MGLRQPLLQPGRDGVVSVLGLPGERDHRHSAVRVSGTVGARRETRPR